MPRIDAPAVTNAGIAAREQYLAALRRTEDGTLAMAALLSGLTAVETVGLCVVSRRALRAAIRKEAKA